MELSKEFCKWHPKSLIRTDDVLVLFPSFPNQSIRLIDQPTAYKSVNDSLKVVLPSMQMDRRWLW